MGISAVSRAQISRPRFPHAVTRQAQSGEQVMISDSMTSFRGALLASAIALATLATGAQAQTYNLRVLHVFSGPPDDGASPAAPVQFDSAGNLYGTTADGGTNNAGTIFKIAKDGTETIVHSFDGAAGGANPNGVTIDQATGDLYGTTVFGGDFSGTCISFCGVLYKLAVDGTFTVLHSFDGANDGSGPDGPLLLDRQGNLYGTATYGGVTYPGTNGNGTVFKYGADGSFT
ncbi:MAG: choice-of-anchor tandem repeat GloVer-containing protein, partial [Rhodanobacteraceae bacterium]